MEQNELLKQAMQVSTPEELLALAKERGTELTGEQAKAYFDRLHQTGELSDEELDNVSGGCGYKPNGPYWLCTNCGDIRRGFLTMDSAKAAHNRQRTDCHFPNLVQTTQSEGTPWPGRPDYVHPRDLGYPGR